MAEVKLSIAGRQYSVACNDGEETRLLALGTMVDEKAREAGGGAAIPQACKGIPLGDQRRKIPGISDQRAVCRFEVGAVALFRFRHGVIGSGRDGVRQAESVKTRPTHFRRHIAKRS